MRFDWAQKSPRGGTSRGFAFELELACYFRTIAVNGQT
ncbi:hypothetical protein ABH975_001358 [Bradyrhizobium ottawaense]